jgi:hypothetical protein
MGSIPVEGAICCFQIVSEPLKTRMFISIAGFLLPQAISRANMTYQQNDGICVGTLKYQQRGCTPALKDTLVKNIKATGTPAGEKHSDRQGLYLHVKEAGKYWRMSYRFNGKQKTLALGVYPAVSLLKARQRRDKARELLADGIDPSPAKQDEKQAKATAAANTFESVGRDWLVKTAPGRAAITQEKFVTWLEKDAFPFIGKMPILTIGPRDVLDKVVHKIQACGATCPH